MKRREFIAFLCIAAAASPLTALAQVPPKQRLVSGLEVPTTPAVAPAIGQWKRHRCLAQDRHCVAQSAMTQRP